ncbi:hypothetical protein SDC9_135987 [bioreactor metagenome]|uniref:Uncharacterized protein n=1 Tax=bioreactor metagenome TaxID=1076179 RepID=A0A645DJ86_9ZZZZ
MQATARFGTSGQRDIQRLFGQTRLQGSLANGFTALVECGFDRSLGNVDCRTGSLLFFGRELAQALQEFGNLAALAKEAGFYLLQCVRVGNGSECSFGFANDLIEVVHGLVPAKLPTAIRINKKGGFRLLFFQELKLRRRAWPWPGRPVRQMPADRRQPDRPGPCGRLRCWPSSDRSSGCCTSCPTRERRH